MALRKTPREQVGSKVSGVVPCCSVILGAVWSKLGAQVVPKPSIPVPRCFYKSGKVVLESMTAKGLILHAILQKNAQTAIGGR